jgi:hypothetical protein
VAKAVASIARLNRVFRFICFGEQIPAIPPQIPHKELDFNPTNQKKKKGKLGA